MLLLLLLLLEKLEDGRVAIAAGLEQNLGPGIAGGPLQQTLVHVDAAVGAADRPHQAGTGDVARLGWWRLSSDWLSCNNKDTCLVL